MARIKALVFFFILLTLVVALLAEIAE